MDLDDFRAVLESSGVDVWTFIDAAITVASEDDLNELRKRRDGIVERLYAASLGTNCRNCDDRRSNGYGVRNSIEEDERGKSSDEVKRQSTPPTALSDETNNDVDPFGGLFDDEQKSVMEIKAQLEDPDQSEDSIIELLQSLADMDITFQALKETDIGRHVNKFRKHHSNDVRLLVKHLVRKWKATVDEWVNVNQTGEIASSTNLLGDGDSPQQKIPQNGYHKVPDFAQSPNPHTGSCGSERNNPEAEEAKVVSKTVMRRDSAPMKPSHSVSAPTSRQIEQQKESSMDVDNRLASARRKLQDSYKEAENAKKQRKIQVMDIHEIPKPKNSFFPKNKAGGSHGRQW